MSQTERPQDVCGGGEGINPRPSTLNLASIRTRLGAARGRQYWRSLEELAETEAFQEFLHREFPRQASEWLDPVGRRQFLRLMGAALALAGLSACTPAPAEKIMPYVRAPEDIVPGKPLYFATAMSLGGFATGLLVESHMGRPTKVEGNPDHPASLGATDAFAQASVLTLYDPDRSQAVTYLGRIRPWSAFLQELLARLDDQRVRQGAGLRILTETVTSPTLADQLRAILTQFPAAKWHQYEPVGQDNSRAGSLLAFGEDVFARYRFDNADVIFSLDADFLSMFPGNLRYAREFAVRRRVTTERPEMNRLYTVESSPSLTGAMADHRLPLRASAIEALARTVAAKLGLQVEPGGVLPENVPSPWIDAVVADLQRHRGSSLILVGEGQPPVVHALGHAMNQELGNVGNTVIYTAPIVAQSVDQTASLRELVEDLDTGRVEILVTLSGNPVFTAPANLRFGERLAKAGLRIHLGLHYDETAALCHWHIPEAHYLEAWSDTRAYDGTVSMVQPLIMPLYNGKSAHELLAAFSNQPDRSGYAIVRDYWRRQNPAPDFEQRWERALHDGLIAGTALPPKSVSLRAAGEWGGVQGAPQPSAPGPQPPLEIVFQPDPSIFDGRFANNGWLQELPKPLTKLTWDNAALLSPATAQRLGLAYKIGKRGGEAFADVVELQYRGRAVRAPIWIVPGHADDCVTVCLGHGRTRAGKVGTGTGFNAYSIRTSDAPWFGTGLEIRKTGERYALACTQLHHTMQGRDLVRAATLEEYRQHPDIAHEAGHEPTETPSLYPPVEYKGYAWGMAIDVNTCVGCNACVVACQAENNIPIVGKTEVMRGREMHWLRVDSYYRGDVGNPETYFQPVPCMHCEHAPCELVCPVAATVHSAEGLNDMVYNRCVGTRYCSNNCPYKVRRFNFLQYSDWNTPSLKLLRNPDVTVRSRGVMEKCTYCVQRINAARIEAEKAGRRIRDGEVVTACQAACPTEAIVFGDINDANSRVAKLKAESRNYGLLAELNTRPRTTYLAALRNPNPDIATE
jgi:molybdopterin-containing oxidoreductase family iron-sulfur binding subunit